MTSKQAAKVKAWRRKTRHLALKMARIKRRRARAARRAAKASIRRGGDGYEFASRKNGSRELAEFRQYR